MKSSEDWLREISVSSSGLTRSQSRDGAERSSAQPDAPTIGRGTQWSLINKRFNNSWPACILYFNNSIPIIAVDIYTVEMIRSCERWFLILIIFLFVPYGLYAKRINVHSLDELVGAAKIRNSTIVVKKHIDLEKCKVIFSKGCTLKFKNGSFSNGIVVGNQTVLKNNRKNIFHDCTIAGTWQGGDAYSSMFNVDMGTMQLLQNMSCLSPTLKLSANRSYSVNAQQDTIQVEVIEADGKVKPTISFHTTAPNLAGVVLRGRNVKLRNLVITDDYDEKNDAIYGENMPTIGNTIAVIGPKKIVETLNIEGCEFRGGTSSSWVASSQTKNCIVENCTFTGYMADHGVYCSMKVENYYVKNCVLRDIPRSRGVFKVRSSNNLSSYSIKYVDAHNLNGYLGILSLMETPEAEVQLDHIRVTKDDGNPSVFYGFCFNDESKELSGNGFNINSISLSNCFFDYGYNGSPIINKGAGEPVRVKTINYIGIQAKGLNFAGGNAESVMVNRSLFDDCYGRNGIPLRTRHLIIENSAINGLSGKTQDYLFLINYHKEQVESIALENVKIGANVNNLFNVIKGDSLSVTMKHSTIDNQIHSLFYTANNCLIDFRGSYNMIHYDNEQNHQLKDDKR